MPERLLQVRDLAVQYRSRAAPVLNRLSFDLECGEIIGLLGESGSGKTTLARALIRLLPANCRTVSGSVRFRQTEILQATDRELRALRGKQISCIPQEPELTLNPVIRVGEQVSEVLRAHSRWNRGRRRQEVQSMLADVDLPDDEIYTAYPHELSGGQRQRIVIAQSLILKPSLLIADEPTSALDNVTQAGVLALIKKLQMKLKLSILFITHNPALLYGFADRIMVICAGSIVEEGSFHQVCWAPKHAYTKMLLDAIPPMPAACNKETEGIDFRAPSI